MKESSVDFSIRPVPWWRLPPLPPPSPSLWLPLSSAASDRPEKVAPQLRKGRCFMAFAAAAASAFLAFQYCTRDGASTGTDWKMGGRGKGKRRGLRPGWQTDMIIKIAARTPTERRPEGA